MRRVILAAALAWACHCSAAPQEQFTFAAWNLQNYALQPLAADAKKPAPAPKSATSIAAIVKTLVAIAPDAIGLLEVGSQNDLRHLQAKLKQAGLDLPYSTLVEGADIHRHIALLSRYPLHSINHDTKTKFLSGGLPQHIQRGFLDCVMDVRPGFPIHVLGAHLKSRRLTPEMDQAEVRRFEALALRQRADGILKTEPATHLLVFGDFNDTKNSPAVRGLLGRRGGKASLTLLTLKDDVGDQWTYHWQETDEYSRIDFVMVSSKLRSLINPRASRIHRESGWRTASDHRPLVVTINTPPSSP